VAGNHRQHRRAAQDAARRHYRGLSVIGKRRLLDELQELTGYHRKSLLRLLNRPEPVAVAETGGSLLQPYKPPTLSSLRPGGGGGAGAAVGGERSALRQAAAGVAAAAGGVAREPRAPVSRSSGAGGATGDEQRHDRSDVGADPQTERRQRLAPPTTGLQRRAAAGAGSHVQGLGGPQRTRLAGDRPGGALRRPDGRMVLVDLNGHRHCHWLEREPADRDAGRSGGVDGSAVDPPAAAVLLAGD